MLESDLVAASPCDPTMLALRQFIAGELDPGVLPADVASLVLDCLDLYALGVIARFPADGFDIVGVTTDGTPPTLGLSIAVSDRLRRHFADTAKDLVRVLGH